MKIQKNFRRTISLISIVFVVLIVSFAGLIVANGADGKVGAAVVLSGSMEPALSVNDIVLFVKQDEYEAGDIVVFHDEGMTSVHRIVKQSPDEIITKGDFNNAQDPPITKDKIIGKVKLKVPKLGIFFGSKAKDYGINAKYSSEATAEMSGVVEMEDCNVDYEAETFEGTMIVGVPVKGSGKIAIFNVSSESAKKRKLNIMIQEISTFRNISLKCTVDDGNTSKTYDIVSDGESWNLDNQVEIPAGHYEATVTLTCYTNKYTYKDSQFSLGVFTEFIDLDEDGNATAINSVKNGNIRIIMY